MCLTKKKGNKKHLKSATDIICYKIVLNDGASDVYISPIRKFEYKVGKKYTENCVHLRYLDEYGELNNGVFHSYSLIDSWNLGYIIRHNNYMDNYMVRENPPKFFILECIIPAGTPYWVGECHEYASMSIKVVRAIDPETFPRELCWD